MKRFFALLCIWALLLTLTACAGQGTADAPAPLPDNVAWAVEPAFGFTCIAPATLERGDEAAFYNTCGRITSDGLSEVTIDGKYGLIDHDGKWAVPCEFDSVYCGHWGKYALEKYSDSAGGSGRYIYEPGVGLHRVAPDETGPEGTVVLRKGGSSALCTVTGEEIIPFGIFEELLPLHEGRLWAKYGGKWGVLALKS